MVGCEVPYCRERSDTLIDDQRGLRELMAHDLPLPAEQGEPHEPLIEDTEGVAGKQQRYVRLYDFMSQIVDYGDPYMEMLSIFLRLCAVEPGKRLHGGHPGELRWRRSCGTGQGCSA